MEGQEWGSGGNMGEKMRSGEEVPVGIRIVSLQLAAHRTEARIPFPQWETPSGQSLVEKQQKGRRCFKQKV